MAVALAEGLEVKPTMVWLAICVALGMACGYAIGRLISPAKADWDMRGIGALVGLGVGLLLYGAATRMGG
jgi:hypothetical protein